MKTYAKCSDVNAVIDEKTTLVDGVLSNPELEIETASTTFMLDLIKLGLKKALSQDTAGKVSEAKILEVIKCWQAGYALLTLKKDAEKPAIVKSGKAIKSQFTQADIASALRATLGADDSRAKLVEGLKDELFLTFMEKRSGESYMVEAIAFLKRQDEILAEKEKRELEEQLAALGL
jgi:hypothetical protein